MSRGGLKCQMLIENQFANNVYEHQNSAIKTMIFLLIYETNQDSHFLLIVINSEENANIHSKR